MGAALRLFTGEPSTKSIPENAVEAAAGSSATLSIRDAYHELSAELAAVSLATHKNYEQALTWWERLTGNPPLETLRQTDVTAFRADLQTLCPATTANKHLRSLRALLNRLGPANARYPDALELLAKVPFVKLLNEESPVPLHLTETELNALWTAAAKMTWPRTLHIRPADWWRCLIVLGINYGPRIGDLLGLSRNNIVLGPDETAWIKWRAQKTGKIHAWPLTEAACRAMKPLEYDPDRIGADPEFRILPTPTNPAKLYSTFRRLCEVAGVSRPDPLSFHALRSTAAKRYDEYSRGLGAVILGHAVEKSVTNKHYLGDAALADAYHAIRNISQPERFIR